MVNPSKSAEQSRLVSIITDPEIMEEDAVDAVAKLKKGLDHCYAFHRDLKLPDAEFRQWRDVLLTIIKK